MEPPEILGIHQSFLKEYVFTPEAASGLG